MAPKELQDLLTKYIADNYGPEPTEEGLWEHTPQIEYRVSPSGARLVMFDFDYGQPDLHLTIRGDDHLRAVLNGSTDNDWLKGNGEQWTIPQPTIVNAKN
jgi:hypothetical protein